VANDAPISIGPGRHMNDKPIPFSPRDPSGFALETGGGGIGVGDDRLPRGFGVPDLRGRRRAGADPFAAPERAS
jgi:hypothetical protein